MAKDGHIVGDAEIEAEGKGLETPVVSVTIAPRGRCYRLAVRVGEQLARLHSQDISHRPHLTLQGIYGDADVALINSLVHGVAAATRPFTVEVFGIGVLVSPVDPQLLFLHLNVQKSEPLVELYARLKQDLDAHGLRTYSYSPEEWVPHLTLASGRWSGEELKDLLRELNLETPDCILPVAEVDVNCRGEDGNWHSVDRHPFAPPDE